MNFAEMIQKWMKYDYCTQGIKSEVIIDLISILQSSLL
jgi:hypothetical protein